MDKKKSKKLFRGQKEDELVVMIFRKHWFSFGKPIVISILMLVVCVTMLSFWVKLPLLFLIIGLVLLIIDTSYFAYNFLLWWNDVYILTNIRVIDIDQRSLFNKTVTEAELKNIQDITYEINGFWRTILNYGKVEILTASNGKSISFEDVLKPHEVQQLIIKTKDSAK